MIRVVSNISCPAHPHVENLKAIKPNCTSVLQPMDQDVINSLKTHYRRMQILETIRHLELEKESAVTLLDAILMISDAWENVSPKTIANCFRHAGFSIKNEETIQVESDFDEEDDIPLARLINNVTTITVSNEDFLELVNVDHNLETCGDISEEDIVKNLSEDLREDLEENDDEDVDDQVPSCAEALQAVSIIKKFVTLEGLKDSKLLSCISTLDTKLAELKSNSRQAQAQVRSDLCSSSTYQR
ncbi:tigger transposable element-derived protein 4-like [Zophobas morio]|uniref:tigger transposable element-derived protein 4-like n=1 Tax=Zophobas morio TaxID=2755281 RepID=UPI003083E449